MRFFSKGLFACAALLLLSAAVHAQNGRVLEPVVLQLKWKHQFQFAGYYAAAEKGYYREAGIAVDIREAQEGRDPVVSVLDGSADFGIGASELALHRGMGKPVVVLAVILQHSPLVLLTGSDVKMVQDIVGKRVMLLPQEAELYAYLQGQGVSRDRIIQVPHSFSSEDLVKGRVDGLSGYSTDEPFMLNQMRFAHNVFSPRSGGIDFYGDALFTSERALKKDARRVAAFRDASLRGWKYAMEHPEEIADLIIARYGKRHSREHLLFEAAEMRRLMQLQLIEIGHIHPGRWSAIAAVYAEFGMLPAQHDLDGFIFDSAAPRDLAWFYRGIAAALAAALLGGVVAVRQMTFNRRLRNQLDDIQALQAQLVRQALRDSLTGLYNRRYFDEALQRELALARRQNNYPVSLVMIDIDRFKVLNDNHGHQAGDAVLQALARYLTENSRASDIVCRWGGEEFVILMPHTPLEGALQRTEVWRESFSKMPVSFGGLLLNNTFSAGVAVWPVVGVSSTALLRAADDALYRAKSEGRNRVCPDAPAPEA